MKVVTSYKIAFISGVVLLLSNCSYLKLIQSNAHHKIIENSITTSRLDGATVFFGRAPLSKAYEFNFTNTRKKSYSLIFTVHESSFSNSTLKYLAAKKIRRDADQINEEVGVLKALNKNLPQTNEVAWQTINQQSLEEAQEGYQLMLDYIRYKIRQS